MILLELSLRMKLRSWSRSRSQSLSLILLLASVRGPLSRHCFRVTNFRTRIAENGRLVMAVVVAD